jgi:integrase
VFERADGLWSGEVSLGFDGNGKRKRKTVYGTTKAEVLDKIAELRGLARSGTLPDAGTLTVGQFLDRWLQTSKGRTSDRTHEERERVVNTHLRPRMGGLRLAKLSTLHVEGLYADMRRDVEGAWATRHAADVLTAALGHAVRLKLIPNNPAASDVVPKPRTPKPEIQFLTQDQVNRLLAAARGQRVYPLVAAALGTGCRQGELLGLTWADIDLKAGTLSVRRSLSMTKAGFVLKEPKTAAGRRMVSLPPFVVEALTALKAEALKAGQLAAPVFCTRTGGYLQRKNVLRAFRAAVVRTNRAIAAERWESEDGAKPLPAKVRFHDLRHTVASLLLSDGGSLRAVSQRLGHSNPALTLRVYAHCMPTDDERLADALARLIC